MIEQISLLLQLLLLFTSCGYADESGNSSSSPNAVNSTTSSDNSTSGTMTIDTSGSGEAISSNIETQNDIDDNTVTRKIQFCQ